MKQSREQSVFRASVSVCQNSGSVIPSRENHKSFVSTKIKNILREICLLRYLEVSP